MMVSIMKTRNGISGTVVEDAIVEISANILCKDSRVRPVVCVCHSRPKKGSNASKAPMLHFLIIEFLPNPGKRGMLCLLIMRTT